MLAYVCKYVPIEVFKALGEDIEIIDGGDAGGIN